MNFHKLMTAACCLAGALLLGGCAVPNGGGGGKVVLSTDKIYPAIGPYSQMIGHGKLIYFSGIISLDITGTTIVGATTAEQTRGALEYIAHGLASQGLGFEDVVMSTVYMKDLNDFAAMNQVYAQFFKKDPPARATLQVARLPRDAMIEIAIVAARR